jgi:thiol-disulfide isomerase/thioredoxin
VRKRRLLLASAAASLAALGAFLVLLLRSSPDASAPLVHGQRLTLVAPARRKALPAMAGASLAPPPATLRLADLGGKPAFIDVWASWCVPCREEAPMLARLWRRYRGQVQFLGIDVEDSRADARRFTHQYHLGYPNIFDGKAGLAGRLGFYGLPTAYLVDERGRLAARLVGKQKERRLASGLAALAREAKSRR